ncbi:Eco57I restriction-modification methylase domain-containing protein [Amphritea sp.]|uniref:Eco57I restriction-modification methylase domain-containing protein n=1 Tax=Amphritea sp. TaxID=1872502 RepID=UPI003D11C910
MSVERYSHVESRKREGAHYTPVIFSDFISENIISNAKLGKTVKIVDPAVGDGELLISLIKNLKLHGISNIEAHGFDTNPVSIEITRERLKESHPDITPFLHHKDFLQACLEKGGLSDSKDLFASSNIPDFDLLIANPPYIRTQVLGAEQAQLLSKNFGLKGRVDIYQAFLVAMKSVLSRDGIAGVIVSNRFLTTKGAGKFREILYNQYEIKGIWDFGDTKVFEAAVLPAVMLLSPCTKKNNSHVPFLSAYIDDKNKKTDLPFVENQIDALRYTGTVRSKQVNYKVKNGHLTFDSKPSDLWRLQDEESEEWLGKVASNTWCSFKDIGKIRVGVKTTADNVFIRSDWESDIGYKPELLLPLTTHHVANRFKCTEDDKKAILYTHTVVEGKRNAYNLDDFPLSKKYLEDNKEQLAGRKYVIEANRQWFEIWVPQNPLFWSEPKIIFRDITEQPTFWMDNDGTVVNGDCYWMLKDNKDAPNDILWLVLAIANSRFIEDFYDIKFQNKLYSNRRRFITQYVEQFPIPDPSLTKSIELITLAKQCYDENDEIKRGIIEQKIDKIVWSIFDVPHIENIMD